MEAKTCRLRPAAVLLATCLAVTALLAGGCGSSDDDAPPGVAQVTTGASQPAGGAEIPSGGGGAELSQRQIYDGLLKYSKCMREHGVSSFPDPVIGKGLQVNGNEVGQGTAAYKSADDVCKSLMPGGAGADDAPADRTAALKYSKCMRDQGVTKFPDPAANGSVDLDIDKIGMAPDNPVFQAALKACQQYLGSTNTNGNGG
ncbi:hypothetical protein [Paractinoplanes ferrugineus]|uniref:Lipoprotein n=1 Tax=Paractinoplanes ferrugineus TaxID=113564 RepID=A0A919J4G2_9ACTN|nr:hypothetical protein [Actinoplanes ferrugineus]GIE13808.1 hypothetical protein Afe05nite_56480 [Actinoplanes ferrugineus]